MRRLLEEIWPTNGVATLADLGCRDCWHTTALPGVKRHIGVEIWPDALARGVAKGVPGFEPVELCALEWCRSQAARSVDVVLAIDMVEHLEEPRGLELIEEMARVARVMAAVWTTLGFVEQGPFDVDGNPNPHEQHVWGPMLEDFTSRGWYARAYPRWHGPRGGGLLAWLYIG